MRLFILCFTVISFSLNSQCVISDVEIDRSICDENDLFNVSLNFNYDGVGDSGFRVQGNGINHGEFSYDDLPIVIEGLEGNCDTEWEFVIRDIDTPECKAEVGLGVVCCSGDCALEIVDFELGDCQNGGFAIAFDAESSMSGGLGVNVFLNDNLISTVSYEDLPTELNDVVGMNDIENEFVICDQDNPNCCDTLTFESPCACSIKNIVSRIVDCDAEDSTYNLLVNFDTNLVSDSFQVGTPGNFLGVYAYEDLPLVVGPGLYDADTIYYLFVDQKNTFCFSELAVPPLELCDTMCVFDDIDVSISMCEDEKFYASISFTTNNPGVLGFTIQGNGEVYGEDFQYGMDTYEIGPLLGDCETIYEFVLIDNQLPDCQGVTGLEEPVCCLDCSITELVVEAICGEENVDSLYIDFVYEYSADSTFIVMVNDSIYGPYHGDDLPLVIDVDLPSDEEIRVLVEDTQDEGCRKLKELLPECGSEPCPEYFDIKGEYSDCFEDNTFWLGLSFKVEGATGDVFYIVVGDEEFGPFEHGQVAYEVGPLMSNCEKTVIKFIDGARPDCTQVHEFDEIKCCEEDCPEYFEIKGEYTECFEDNKFFLILSFEVEGETGDNFYIVVGDEEFGPYAHGQDAYEVGPLMSNCEKTVIKFIDGARPDCTQVHEFDEIKCCEEDCEIGEVGIEVECEEGEMVGFFINVFPKGDLFTKYIVEISGDEAGPFDYEEVNFIDVSLANGVYTLIIRDIEFPDCAKEVKLEVECNSDMPCSLENLIVETVNCTEETFMFLIDVNFDFPGTDLFQVFINGELLGTSSYSLLPVTTAALERGQGPWKILIKDFERPDCAIDIEIEEELCESSLHEEFDDIEVYYQGGEIYFSKQNDLSINVTMFDILGRVSHQSNWTKRESSILPMDQMKGIQFVRLEYNGKIHNVKIYIP